MVSKHVNVVSLDVPDPPDYGGVIDIFYKVKALSALGVAVHLHCFTYGRNDLHTLEKYCAAIYKYPRKTGWWSNLSLLPYITYSRRDEQLIVNLSANNYPIIFEGLHTVYPLFKTAFVGRQLVLRSHNIEHDYYRQLALKTSNPIKKVFFLKEAFLLKRMLTKLPVELTVGAISPADEAYLKQRFTKTFWLPPFHANEQVSSESGTGSYALYHGNLSVAENNEIAFELINAFGGKSIPLTIAGKNPSSGLQSAVEQFANIKLIADPTASEMEKLIRDAQAILLLTNQSTGIKLKLIESLYRGRFCLANDAMVNGTKLEELVERVSMATLYSAVEAIMQRPFTTAEKARRERVLRQFYHNATNAALLLDRLGVVGE